MGIRIRVCSARGAAHPVLPKVGLVIGTPRYMSPEQASGDVIDNRSDFFSLGCMLCEMLAGEMPRTSGAFGCDATDIDAFVPNERTIGAP